MSLLTVYSGTDPLVYDHQLGPVLFEPFAADLAKRADSGDMNSVLELACGTGILTARLLEKLPPQGRLVATDINPGMMERAKAKLSDNRLSFQLADAGELPFSSESFSQVICQFGFMFLSNKPQAFMEACRVLKPGGRLLFNTWDGPGHNPRTSFLRFVLEECLGEAAPDLLHKGPYSFFDRDQIRQSLTQAGLCRIHVEPVVKKVAYTNLAEFSKALIDGSPLKGLLKGLAAQDLLAVRQKVFKALQNQEAEYGQLVPMQALVCEGYK